MSVISNSVVSFPGIDRVVQHLFHPLELVFCGRSNSGKTTLISRLLATLSTKYTIGYAKHADHRIDMDREGKDTDRARRSGAKRVFISGSSENACLFSGAVDFVEQKSMFSDCELLFIEGYKNYPGKKILVLGDDPGVQKEFRESAMEQVIAVVGSAVDPGPSSLNVPYFQRDQIEEIVGFVERLIERKTSQVPLYGLVLAGGRSTRMKTDKALLAYQGRTQVEVAIDLISGFCERTYLSSRKGQWADGTFSELRQVHDRLNEFGPIGGILSAMLEFPDCAWLVVACDLPYLDEGTLAELVANRHPLKLATAYDNPCSGLPEPLCTIYEPRMRSRMFEFLGWGWNCPREILLRSNVQRVKLANVFALENVNTRAQHRRAGDYFEGILQRSLETPASFFSQVPGSRR